MPTEDELKTQLKRLNYWSSEVPYQAPKKVVKQPDDITLEDIMVVQYGDYLKSIKLEYHD
jgi:hypothetical protein